MLMRNWSAEAWICGGLIKMSKRMRPCVHERLNTGTLQDADIQETYRLMFSLQRM